MRVLDEAALAEAAQRRFRSDYDYAEWEYLRSAKVLEALERAGARPRGRVLDAGCGGGGTALSLAEEAELAVGLDLEARFAGSGTRLAAERDVANVGFVQGDAVSMPFAEGCFDLVFSHSVIEHVASAEAYLAECQRVLRPGGVLYLSTAPYLSFAGAHLPRLRVPVPLHLLLGRRLAFLAFRFLGRHAPFLLREPKEANTFVSLAAEGKSKRDDLLQRVTCSRLAAWLEGSGLRIASQEFYVTGFFRRFLPGPLRRFLVHRPFFQDVMIGHVQTVLVKP